MKSTIFCKIVYARNNYYNNREWLLSNFIKYFKSYSIIIENEVFLLADRKQVILFETYNNFSSFKKIMSFKDFAKSSLLKC